MTRGLALFLTVLTGFTGLVYEVTWQRYLAILLGSQSEATAAVLGIFLGGLAVGYALFGRVARRRIEAAAAAGQPPRLLRLYGGLEAAIGAWALLFPAIFQAARWVSLAIPQTGEALGFAFDVLLSAALIGPPSVLMGATIPILTQALARSLADATRLHARVYAFNTAGAFAGALAAAFWLVPALGLGGTLAAMGLINLGVGATFAVRGGERAAAALPAAEAPPPVERFAFYAAVAVLAGFAMAALQTVLIRLGGLAFGSSEFTFATVVAVFVLAIALGSFAVAALPRIPRWLLLANLALLVVLLLALYGWLPQAPYWAYVLRSVFASESAAFLPYQASVFLAMLAVLGPVVLLSGATLPLLFHELRRSHGELGAVAGRLYSLNTLGSLLGALLGGYLLLVWLDLHHVYRLAVMALASCVGLLGLVLGGRMAAAGLVLLAVAGIVLIRLEPWDPRMLASGFFRTRRVTDESYRGSDAMLERRWRTAVMLSYEDDPTTSVAVAENTLPDGRHYRSLLVNGKADGATQGDNNTTGLLALLPALFSELPERAFVVGYGTGHTAGELAALSANREVVVAEISSGVVRAAPLFDFASLDASSNPKIRIHRGDAYRALLRSSGSFDVIVSEPSNPWVTGVEMLYSLEFLSAARERLSAGGVFAQWLHQYESDREMLSLVLRTYAAVFDHVAVWYGGGRDLILLGFKDDRAALDVTGLAWRASQPDFAAGLARAEIEDFPQLLAHELLPLGVVHAADLKGPLHSLYRPLLNALGARAFFRAAVGELPFTGFGEPARVGANHSLLSRYEAATGGELPATVRQRVVAESCRHRTRQCTALLADWSRATTGADLYAQTLNQALRQPPRLGGRIDASELSQLNTLLADGPGDRRALTPEAAERLTRLVVEHYQHAAPVDRDRVLSIWDRCRPDSPRDARCEQGLTHARTLFTQGH